MSMTLQDGRPFVALGKVIHSVQSGFASGERSADGVVQLRMNNVSTDGGLDLSSHIRVPTTTSQIEKYGLHPGDVLFNSTNSLELVGKTAVFTGFPEPVVFSNHFARLRVVPDKLDPFYLAHWLLVKWQHRIFEHLATAWVNQASVRKEDLLDLRLPLPPLAEQQRIAGLLRRADRLRRLRRYALAVSAGYLQAVFVDMFGDPVRNPMGFPRVILNDVILSTKDGPHVSPDYVPAGIPFLSTRNIRPGEIIWDDLKHISQDEAEKHWLRQDCKPHIGDILYTKGGTTGLAKVVDFPEQVAVWVHIAVLKLRKDRVEPLWLENMLNSTYCYRQSQALTMGIVNRDLGLTRMVRIEMYLPSLNLQRRFAQIAHQYQILRRQQEEALRQAEHLFQALLWRAFAGEGVGNGCT